MKTTQEILSMVQKDIGDSPFDMIQRQEYVDFIEEVVNDIATVTGIKQDVQSFIGGGTNIIVIPPNFRPLKIDLVMRGTRNKMGGVECFEQSKQAIDLTAKQAGYAPPPPTPTPLPNGFFDGTQNMTIHNTMPLAYGINNSVLNYNTFSANRYDDERMELEFATPLGAGEEVTIYYTTDYPVAVTFDSSASYSDSMAKCIRYGVLEKVCERLIFSSAYPKYLEWQAKQKHSGDKYHKEKMNLASYTIGLKDSNSAYQIQPFKFL